MQTASEKGMGHPKKSTVQWSTTQLTVSFGTALTSNGGLQTARWQLYYIYIYCSLIYNTFLVHPLPAFELEEGAKIQAHPLN